ncbi:hypothetical protein [Nostoc sp. FACHB-280]|uniref:hypothetical protein n=1 Tax=Nostoc sp. FACHB-280 TaxID=2692839 RepID=UPI0019C7FAB0|nr:hypothetical protein [Nostoc sp. FACHB-280]MBD2493358.1 hypothetical protein [Nostoc sp. FACHB-280]
MQKLPPLSQLLLGFPTCRRALRGFSQSSDWRDGCKGEGLELYLPLTIVQFK